MRPERVYATRIYLTPRVHDKTLLLRRFETYSGTAVQLACQGASATHEMFGTKVDEPARSCET